MTRTSLAIQLLKLRASTAGDTGLIPDQGTNVKDLTCHTKKKKVMKETENNRLDNGVLV